MSDKSRIVEQIAKEMPDMKETKIRMTNLHLYANGVFSNVYRGQLILPNQTKEIAIKKTWPATHDRTFEMVFLTGQCREKHKNIIQMLYAFSNRTKDNKICESFVFEFMPETLDSLIRKKEIDYIDIKLYTWQLFNGIKYLASESIVHRDVKPVNTLVDPVLGILKIGDFGSAKIMNDPLKKSTAYQVTRFYRPPELLLCDKVVDLQIYNHTVDIWSGGCVFGEMLRGKVLFAGRDSMHQLRVIFSILGTPTPSDIHGMLAPVRIEGEPKPGNGFLSILPNTPLEAVLFIEKILVYKPKERLGGKELLRHSFFDSILSENAKRSNGQAIRDIITPGDLKESQIEIKKNGAKLLGLMGKKMDFTIQKSLERLHLSTEKEKLKMGSSSDSNEDVNIYRKPAPAKRSAIRTTSAENVLRLKSSSENTQKPTVKTSAETLQLKPTVRASAEASQMKATGKLSTETVQARGKTSVEAVVLKKKPSKGRLR